MKFIKSLLRYVAVLLMVAGSFSATQGQNLPGTNDPSFNTADVAAAGDGFNNTVSAVALQPDGKIVAAGNFTSFVGGGNRIARLNADGSLDNSFNIGTGFNTAVQSLALQPDGKIVAGGLFTSYNGTNRNRIVRLNADGTLDASFNLGTGFNAEVHAIALQPDDKIVVGGKFISYDGTERNRIARLNADGTLDASFNPGTGFTGNASSSVYSLALQPDGKIMVGGSFSYDNGIKRYDIARLNADGTLDTSFSTPEDLIGPIFSIALQPDGKVVIGGGLLLYHNGTRISTIARLNADGTLDGTFNTERNFNHTVRSIALQPDGKIVVGGQFTTHHYRWCNYIARINTDGTNDTSFNPGKGFATYNPGQGTGFNFPVYSVALQPDGKIVAGGDFSSYNGSLSSKIARLNADGTVDGSFIGKGFNQLVRSIALQPDGKIVVGGDFTHYNGTSRSRIARLNADGTLDESFNPGTGFDSDNWPIYVQSIALQPDGKIVVGGSFTSYNGTGRNRIVRLNADGTLDASFDPGAGFYIVDWSGYGSVDAIVMQPDGKIVVGGGFDSFNGTRRNGIARLNADGTLDDSYNPGTGSNPIALQPDGKLVVERRVLSSNGTWRSSIARLNIDGTLDASFNLETGFDGPVSTIALQHDGKIVVGGRFTFSDGTERKIARLNADGSLDTSFNPEFNPRNSGAIVHSIALQNNGKIVVAGAFSLNNGTGLSNSITRLNADGTLDASFDPGTGFNGEVRSVVLQPDGKIVAGGWFTTYNNIPRRRIARLFGDEGAPLSTGKELQAGPQVLVYPNPSQEDVHIRFSGAEALVGAVKLVLHDAMGRQVLSRELTVTEVQAGVQLATSRLQGGVYFLTIQSKEKAIIKRLVLTE